MLQCTEVAATGAALTGNGARRLMGVRLTAAAAASTAILRDGSGAGPVLARLQCAANDVDDLWVSDGLAFTTSIHVTLTGAGATVQLYA